MIHSKKSILLAALCCLLWETGATAQSSSKNYILSREYTNEAYTAYRDKIVYYDGLGRPEETVQCGITPSGKDLVSYQEYDAIGRGSNSWLPVSIKLSGTGDFVYLSSIRGFMSSTYGSDLAPYSKPVYEASPLNRILEQYGPGDAWHNGGKSVKTAYLTNISGNDTLTCPRYSIGASYSATDSLVTIYRSGGNECYPATSLSVIRTTDEDGNRSWEFKDKKDRTVLMRQLADNTFFDTYYIYDYLGNLGAVLPPIASDKMKTGSSWNNANSRDLRDYAYLYMYDTRNRLKADRLPGAGWTYYLYDSRDQLVFSQDAVQRSRSEWSFTLSDVFNRPCLTGICKNTLPFFSPTSPLEGKVVKAVRDNSIGTYKGYSIPDFPLTSPTVLTVNYYDNYDFMGKNGMPSAIETGFQYEAVTEFDTRYTESAATRMTGSMTLTLLSTGIATDPSYLRSVFYYDKKGRVIQSKYDNRLSGGIEKEYLAYSVTDDILKKRHIHLATGKPARTEDYSYEYDQAGRLTSTKHQIDGMTEMLLCNNEYDELGRLKANKRNGNTNLKSEYAYNTRSWTTAINGPAFTQTLHYTDNPGIPLYNCNIGSMNWKSGVDATERGYKFTYDELSRVKNAVYGEGESMSANLNHFTEQVTGYDKQGNIVGLKRHGQTSASGYGVIDDLTMTYNGNQLKKVTDAATTSAYNDGFEFKDRSDLPTEYAYDVNGNLTKDLNKKITEIQYNCLNLASRILFEDGRTISYDYAADGSKLRVQHMIEGITTTTDYCGNVIYENGSQKTLLTEGGYVSLEDGKYHYFIQDHQGNNRVIADQNGNIEEVNHYYPFGGVFANCSSIQPYKYNGKELDRKNGLDWYDYGARQYDAAIGRWNAVDPMAEKYYQVTPYAYCNNEPANRSDINGNDWIKDRFDAYLWDDNAKDQESTRTGWQYVGLSLPNDVSRYSILEEINGGLYHKNTSNPFASLVNTFFDKEIMVEKKAYNPAEDHMMEQFVETGVETATGIGVGKVGGKILSKAFSKGNTKGFQSFTAFKKANGPAGEGQAWHHIVEQNSSNITKFGAENIHNAKNIIKLPHGKGSIHAKISGFYSSKPKATNGLTVRQWLSTQSYQEQYKFGIETLKNLGWKP